MVKIGTCLAGGGWAFFSRKSTVRVLSISENDYFIPGASYHDNILINPIRPGIDWNKSNFSLGTEKIGWIL